MSSGLRTVLIDLSGTLHIDNETTRGAVQALDRLRKAKLNVKFVTNTTKESRRVLHERLVKLGFTIEENEIFSSLWAARDLVVKESLKPFFIIDDKAIEDFEGLTEFEGEADSVVVGLAPNKFDYETMNKAFRILKAVEGRRLVGVHEGRYYRVSDGGLSLGPGPFLRVLSAACPASPVSVCGKPSQGFFEAALGGEDPASAVMIGDDVRDDIAGAASCGVKGILVRTGKFRPSDSALLPPGSESERDFAAAVDSILASAS